MNTSTQNSIVHLFNLKDAAIALQHKGNVIGLVNQINELIKAYEALDDKYIELTKIRLYQRQIMGIQLHINRLKEVTHIKEDLSLLEIIKGYVAQWINMIVHA